MLKKRWKTILLVCSILLLFIAELTLLFLLGPLGFTQEMKDSAEFAHGLYMNIAWVRLVLLGVIILLGVGVFKNGKRGAKIGFGIAILLYALVFYGANFSMNAESLFQDQTEVVCYDVKQNTVPLDKVVLGVAIEGKAKAYPIEYLAFHHKVNDVVGEQAVLPTYCTFCRSGRVFNPVIDGKREKFRLVGMTNYNAVIEDESSKSWWQQANGEAIAGAKKGQQLEEIFSEQMPLYKWIEKHPNTLILQPDTLFNEAYEKNSHFVYRYGKEERGMEYDSWKKLSWIIGVENNEASKAFDFNSLIQEGIVHDSVGGAPVVVLLEADTINFHVWSPLVDTLNLTFAYDQDLGLMMDEQTLSKWKTNGLCIGGPLIGKRLQSIAAYEEYWYSWEAFHPDTDRYGNLEEENGEEEIND